MKKFILKIIYFVAPLIIIMFVADHFISNNHRNSHTAPGEIEVWNDIYAGDIDADIAIYGSSRAWVHIDPAIIEDSLALKAYNFGLDGHNFWLQYLRNLEYLKFNDPPKVILVAVDAFSLQKRKDLYELHQFLPFLFWNQNMIKFTSSYDGFTYKDYYFPLLRYSGRIRQIKYSLILGQETISEIPYRQKGFRGIEDKWNDDLEKAKLSMPRYKAPIDSLSVKLFDHFLDESRKNNIKVILIYTPEYIDGQNFIENRKEIITIYKDFAKKHDLFFLDYSNDEMSRRKELFYNSMHLNKTGADVFTKKLSSDLKPLVSTIAKNSPSK